MKNQIVVISVGGINWNWYYWIEIDIATKTAKEIKSDRYHRSSDRHPKVTKNARLLNKWHKRICGYHDSCFIEIDGVEYPVELG